MIHQLQPYHANLKKRQVKSPKVYVRDGGLLHQLLGLDSMKSLFSVRGWVLHGKDLLSSRLLMTEPHDEVFFWAAHKGAEIDLIMRRGDALYGVECKRGDCRA